VLLEALTYCATLVMFSYVLVASGRLQHEMLLLACIPPVFLALIVGFTMSIYAWDSFGWPPVVVALALPAPAAWMLARRYTPRDLLISIYLAWTVGMVFALLAFRFPDRP
jgi:hypothetical protein